jgi:hypothetical protein
MTDLLSPLALARLAEDVESLDCPVAPLESAIQTYAVCWCRSVDGVADPDCTLCGGTGEVLVRDEDSPNPSLG